MIKRIAFLYEKPWKEYSVRVLLPCYDTRVIFVEKCRAALTRKAYKMRYAIDIVYMEEEYGYRIPDYTPQIKKKVRFMQDTYERYGENLGLAKGHLPEIGKEE